MKNSHVFPLHIAFMSALDQHFGWLFERRHEHTTPDLCEIGSWNDKCITKSNIPIPIRRYAAETPKSLPDYTP
jgi:hypothetical protein